MERREAKERKGGKGEKKLQTAESIFTGQKKLVFNAGKNKQLKDQHANKRTSKKDTNNRSKRKKKKTVEQISAVSNRDVSKQTRRRYQNDVIRRWFRLGGNSLPNSAVHKKEKKRPRKKNEHK